MRSEAVPASGDLQKLTMSSSSTLIHACSPVRMRDVCSCGYQIERFSATWREERRRKWRRIDSDLPEEVLTEVLLRLPVKALIRFKSICKSWYALIDSPSFISMHYTINQSNKTVSFYRNSYCRSARTMSFRFSDTPLEITSPISVEVPEIVGCSYGLVCISPNSRWHYKFIIWNPATRDSRFVYVNRCSKAPAASIYCGFWFDSIADTHKLVRISIYPYMETTWGEHPPGRTKVGLHIFTLSANSWRVKELALPYELTIDGTRFSEKVTCVERCIYRVLVVSNEKRILCFNMADELFHSVEFPRPDCGGCSTALYEYKGSLAMLVWERAASFDMWLLNDFDGVKQSWSKQLTLRPPFLNIRFPLGFFIEDGVALMALCTGDENLLWNPYSGKTRMLWENGCGSTLFRYCESLASVY